MVGTGGFMAENLVLSANREWLIERFGDSNYHRGYSILSTAACLTAALGVWQGQRASGPVLHGAPRRLLGLGLAMAGVAGASQFFPRLQPPVEVRLPRYQEVQEAISSGLTKKEGGEEGDDQKEAAHQAMFSARCPIDFRPRDQPADAIAGLQRITRHPMNYSLAALLLGLGLRARSQAALVLGLSSATWAVVGSAHQDARYRAGSGGQLTPQREGRTSNLPFQALLEGRQEWAPLSAELKWWNMALASTLLLALTAVRLGR
ncbi:MAG: NnrU family protein [archaeon]|nr:NnrU family protein [archaeon]